MLVENVDMNLLRPLRALLEERSVSRAAERLQVSQPTASVALARLRRHFDDPLLVRDGAGYRLTPLAVRLHDGVVTALRSCERVFAAQSSFDPATSRRDFTIYGTDFATEYVGSALVPRLEREAPNVVLRFEDVTSEIVNGAPASLRDCDGMFLPHGYMRDVPKLEILIDRWVCLLSSGNSMVGENPSADELLALQWVSNLDGRSALTPAAQQLDIAGRVPVVSVVTPNFFVIPSLVAGTNRAALVQESFARRVVASLDTLRMVECPFGLEPLREAFWWHPDREDEPEHVWLRGQIEAAAAEAGSAITKPHTLHS